MDNQKYCFIVEIQSGSTDHGDAFVFESVWENEELAQDYCKKRFKDWDYSITKHYFNAPS